MKILVTHSTAFNYKDELYAAIRSSSINPQYEFILPHEAEKPIYTRPLIENKQVSLMIAEASYPSTGQGIEIGWAQVFDVPVICIHKQGMKYSSSLKFVSDTFIEYTDKQDMITKIQNLLQQYEQ